MLWCKLDDKDRPVRPCQRSDVSDVDGRIRACDDPPNHSVTVASRVEQLSDRVTRPPSPGAAIQSVPTSRHPRTVSKQYHQPSYLLSPTSSGNTDDYRRGEGLSSDDVIPPGVSTLDHRPDDVDCPSSMSSLSSDGLTELRRGRLANIEILERIFPLQRRHVLDQVLTGCNGDLVMAIEQFLTVRDTFNAQHGHRQHLHSSSQQQQQLYLHRHVVASGHGRSAMLNGSGSGGAGGLPVGVTAGQDGFRCRSTFASSPMHAAVAKSAFSTPPPPLYGLDLHSAYSPRAAAFMTDTMMASRPPPSMATVPLAPSPLLTSHSPLGLKGWLQSSIPSPSSMIPFLFRHQLYQSRVLPAVSSGLHASLADRYVYQMMIAAAAAAAGQVSPSRAVAAAAGMRPAVASIVGGKRGATSNIDQYDTDEGQAMDLQCRRHIPTSR